MGQGRPYSGTVPSSAPDGRARPIEVDLDEESAMSAPSSSLTFKNKIALLAGVAIAGIVLLTAGAAWTLRSEKIGRAHV